MFSRREVKRMYSGDRSSWRSPRYVRQRELRSYFTVKSVQREPSRVATPGWGRLRFASAAWIRGASPWTAAFGPIPQQFHVGRAQSIALLGRGPVRWWDFRPSKHESHGLLLVAPPVIVRGKILYAARAAYNDPPPTTKSPRPTIHLRADCTAKGHHHSIFHGLPTSLDQAA